MPSTRTFTYEPATRKKVPLLIGIVSCSGAGKSYSALRLATGMQRVIGGKIGVVDTEQDRMLAYADFFKFEHMSFTAPFGSLDYLAAIEKFYKDGIKIIIVDSMTHEHSGVGGYLDSAEQFVIKRIADEPEMARRQKRQPKSERELRGSLSRSKWIKAAEDRKKLITGIVQMGINGIFCFRANEKLDDDFNNLGWHPETTSKLIYEMQQQFLLLPGSDGKPKFLNATADEKKLVKSPQQFRDWFKEGQQLDEDIGERMARWAAGGEQAIQTASNPAATQSVATSSASDAISEPQRKRMYAIYSQAGWKDEEVKQMLKSRYGIESSKAIPRSKYDEIIKILENGVTAVAPPHEEEFQLGDQQGNKYPD